MCLGKAPAMCLVLCLYFVLALVCLHVGKLLFLFLLLLMIFVFVSGSSQRKNDGKRARREMEEDGGPQNREGGGDGNK